MHELGAPHPGRFLALSGIADDPRALVRDQAAHKGDLVQVRARYAIPESEAHQIDF